MATHEHPASDKKELRERAWKWTPVVDADYCVGCGTCVKACPRQCLALVWDFSTLMRPGECVSCGACMAACPHNVIRMDWVEMTGDRTVGRWRETPPQQRRPAPPRGWLSQLFNKRERAR